MNLREQIEHLKDDRDVVEPFAERLLLRLRQKHPNEDIRLGDIDLTIGLRLLNGPAQIHRMLDDMIKESVVI